MSIWNQLQKNTHTQHSIASDIQLEISWLPSELCKSIDVWIAATWTVGKTAGVLKSTWFPCQKIIIFFLQIAMQIIDFSVRRGCLFFMQQF